jgi:uncharacterized protein (TIGR00369 family)
MKFHDLWLKNVETFRQKLALQNIPLKLPPPSLIELGIEYLEVEPGEFIRGKFPFDERFANPLGTCQGGILTAALDEHFGPLAYLTADSPCPTLSLNTTFLRPFSAEMGYCLIEVTVLKKSSQFIFMRGTVTSPSGDILAHAESHVVIFKSQSNRG